MTHESHPRGVVAGQVDPTVSVLVNPDAEMLGPHLAGELSTRDDVVLRLTGQLRSLIPELPQREVGTTGRPWIGNDQGDQLDSAAEHVALAVVGSDEDDRVTGFELLRVENLDRREEPPAFPSWTGSHERQQTNPNLAYNAVRERSSNPRFFTLCFLRRRTLSLKLYYATNPPTKPLLRVPERLWSLTDARQTASLATFPPSKGAPARLPACERFLEGLGLALSQSRGGAR